MADEVAQAGDTLAALAVDVGEDGVRRLEVRVDVAEDGDHRSFRGFGTDEFTRQFDEKYGVTREKAECVETKVVTAAVIGEENLADCPRLPQSTNATKDNFAIRERSGDGAYLSADNLDLIELLGGHLTSRSRATRIWATRRSGTRCSTTST